MGQAWKDLERTTAKILGGKRVIRADYSEKNVDVEIEDFPRFKVDTKRYKKFRAFSLYEQVREKYCKEATDEPILVLRQHNKKTKLAVIDLNLLGAFLDFIRERGGQHGFDENPVH